MLSLLTRWSMCALVLSAVSAARADTTFYLVNGELGTTNSDPSPIDGGTFELMLSFDEPTLPDGERSSFGSPTLVYVAQDWSLALFGETGLVAEYNPTTHPEALGFAELAGQPGFEDGETFISLGVDDDAFSDAGPLAGNLVAAAFFAPTLVDAFFTDRLVDIPDDLAFTAGAVFEQSTSQDVAIDSATLAAVSIDGEVIAPGTNNQTPGNPGTGNPGTPGDGSPSAVPSPTAAAGGLVLMFAALSRRRRAAVGVQ